MGKYRDLTNMRFGRLVAVEFVGSASNGAAMWRVRCDCGAEFVSLAANLVHGKTRSCGCLRKDLLLGKPSRNKGGYTFEYRKYVGKKTTPGEPGAASEYR